MRIIILLLLLLAHCHAHISSDSEDVESMVTPFSFDLPLRVGPPEKLQTFNLSFSVCVNERIEDAFDGLFFYSEFNFGPIAEEYKDAIRKNAYNITGTMPDGHPPRKMIGMLHNSFFIREHYDPVDVFLCYCSTVGCSPDQRALSVWSYIHDSIREAAEIQAETDSTLPLATPPPRIGISLGMTCRAAKLGVEMGLRHTKEQGYRTCPFDLIVSNYEGVVQCIKDDFRYLTDSRFLQLGTDNQIRNTYYNFIFMHESPRYFYREKPWANGENHFLNDDFFFLKERYQRRIESFLAYLNSGIPIVFLLEFHDEVGDRDTEELDRALRDKYPRLDFRIKTLWNHHDEATAELLRNPS